MILSPAKRSTDREAAMAESLMAFKRAVFGDIDVFCAGDGAEVEWVGLRLGM